MPSGRCLPSAFDMYFRRDGNARYVPALTRAWRSARLASRFSAYWSHVTSSTPGAARFLQVEESPPQAIGADMMQERREAFLPVPGNGRAEQTLDRRVTSPYASYLQRDPWF